MSHLTNAAALLDLDDRSHEDVEVPEWGGMVVRVGSLQGTERGRFESYCASAKGRGIPADFRERLLVRCIVHPETGERIFSDAQAPALGKKCASGLKRVFDVASQLNGLGLSDMEQAEKNSASDQSDDSGSSSPPSSDAASGSANSE